MPVDEPDRSKSSSAAEKTPADKDSARDAEALRAWYAANYQPDGPKSPAQSDRSSTDRADEKHPPLDPSQRQPIEPPASGRPDELQELPSVTPELLGGLRQRKQADATARAPRPAGAAGAPGRASPGSDPAAAAAAQREERRQLAGQQRQQNERKNLRFRFYLFCAFLIGTILVLFAIHWIVQTKFGGKMPFFN